MLRMENWILFLLHEKKDSNDYSDKVHLLTKMLTGVSVIVPYMRRSRKDGTEG